MALSMSFATVYRAKDTTLDREVALKVLDPLLMRDEVWITRFHQEAKTVASLKHDSPEKRSKKSDFYRVKPAYRIKS